MSSPKKFTCKGNLGQVFICLWPRTQYPFPPKHCVLYVYSILIHTGKGGGGRVELERRSTLLGRKYLHDCMTVSPLQSINSEITCRKIPFQVNIFRLRHFALVSILLFSPMAWAYTKGATTKFEIPILGARFHSKHRISLLPFTLCIQPFWGSSCRFQDTSEMIK